MKQGKKIEKRLNDRIKGYEQIINNSKITNKAAFRKPGSRKK